MAIITTTIALSIITLLLNLHDVAWKVQSASSSADLYNILGVKRTATSQEIRHAYRSKAKDTHPDKRQGDADVAVLEFRAVVEAYETLSDETSRRNYDRTGLSANAQQNSHSRQQNNGGGGWQWQWQWNQWSGESNQQQYQRQQTHRFLFDYYLRRQILDAQSRVVTINPRLSHLSSVLFGDNDFEYIQQIGSKLDKYVLIAFYDSGYDTSLDSCSHILFNQVLYPWPFAGYSVEREVSGVWWEDLVTVAKVDLNIGKSPTRLEEEERDNIIKAFQLETDDQSRRLKQVRCPAITMLQRGETIRQFPRPEIFKQSETFTDFVSSWMLMDISPCTHSLRRFGNILKSALLSRT
jgi:curved DNA-binding protein CbpA